MSNKQEFNLHRLCDTFLVRICLMPVKAEYFSNEILKINKNGRFYRVRAGYYEKFWRSLVDNQWEPETFAIIEKFADKKHSYIDIGAWIGPTLLYGCQIAKKAYGIEPDPIAYQELICNILLNRDLSEKLEVFPFCVAPSSGVTILKNLGDGGDSRSSMLYKKPRTSWKVLATTFDEFVQHHHLYDCSFIKIDIEGGEYLILPTMIKYLKEFRPTLYLSIHITILKHKGTSVLSFMTNRFIIALNAVKIISSLIFYKNLYDIHGNKVEPLSLLTRNQSYQIVATDMEWQSSN